MTDRSWQNCRRTLLRADIFQCRAAARPVVGRLTGFFRDASVFRARNGVESTALHGLAEFTTEGSFYTTFGGRITVDERKMQN